MNHLKKYSVCCDIGGSHISCLLIDIETGILEDKSLVSIKVDNNESSETLLKTWTKAINNCKNNFPDNSEFIGVSMAIPGPFDYENGIGLYDNSNQKFVHLNNINIKEELAERLDQLRGMNKLVEAQRLEQRCKFDMEMMRELGYCSGIENYSRYLSGRKQGEAPPTLFE